MTLLIGTLTATSPLQVRLDGSSTPVPAQRLAAYSPHVGDRVLVAVIGSQSLVLGNIV